MKTYTFLKSLAIGCTDNLRNTRSSKRRSSDFSFQQDQQDFINDATVNQ